jgi:two-component system, chemotaxis family, chemotaxis protein CheY
MKTIQVLIVDDCAVTRKMVQAALCRAPVAMTILQAGNGQQRGLIRVEVIALEAASAADAITIMNENQIDLIFSDINMPGMDGMELLRQLRSAEKTKNIPVVMITADGSASRVTEALTQGANSYLKKPFSSQEVRDRTERILEIGV